MYSYYYIWPKSPQVHSHGAPACMHTYTGADKGQHAWPKHQSFIPLYPVLFGGCRVCGWGYYHCIIKQLVSEWIGFVGGVSEKG